MRIPTAIVAAVGDELVGGRRQDVNGAFLVHRLETLAFDVQARLFLPDDEERLASMLSSCLESRPDVLAVAGGLGPTEDDRTRSALASAIGIPLELDEEALERLEARYRERGREVPEGSRRQALRPEGSTLLHNPVGPAPGFMIRVGPTLVVALPGVPRELEAMFERGVLPALKRDFIEGAHVVDASWHVVGLPESEVNRLVFEALEESAELQIGLLAKAGEVEVRATLHGDDEDETREMLARVGEALEARLGDHVHGRDGDTLVGAVRNALARRGYTLGSAESCTGGLIAKSITDLSGSSTFFKGSIVSYADAEKTGLLGVDAGLIEACGAVSAEVAAAMARGARQALDVDVAVSSTGIAGPTGGSVDKPVGLVYIGIATPESTLVVQHTLQGDREAIRRWTAKLALDLLRRTLLGLEPVGEVVSLEGASS